MNDLISRKALCDYALNQKDKSVTPNDIMRFPSAQPERKKGKWIRHDEIKNVYVSYNDNDNTHPIAYPARVPFRGFDENCNDRGYREVTQYLNDNIGDLLKEVNDETD